MENKKANIRMAFIRILGRRIEYEIQKPENEIDYEIIDLCDQLLSFLIPETHITKKKCQKKSN